MKQEEMLYLKNSEGAILSSCKQISSIIERILNFGQGAIDLKRLQVSQILEGFRILSKMVSKKYGIPLKVDVEKDLPDVWGDSNAVCEILTTYMDNSCQALKDTTEKIVNFRVFKCSNEHVRFEISDNGYGMTPEIQKAIFDVSTSTKGTEGHGIGLITVRKIKEDIEGSQYGFSSPGRGQGAKFWFDLKIITD